MSKIKLSNRGLIFVGLTISLIPLSIQLRLPPLMLFTTLSVCYILAFPLSQLNSQARKIRLDVSLRHGILFRGEPEILQIRVMNPTYQDFSLLTAEVVLPPTMYIINHPNTFLFSLASNSEQVLNIPILPTARGTYIVGPVRIKLGDPFSIYELDIDQVNEIPCKVYPRRIGTRVSKAKARQIFNKMIGLFASRRRGLGTDFHGLRDYIRGDPVKIIDWAATARNNQLISKEFEEEKKLEVLIAFAAGTTTRGSKFDFMLGVAMDLYEGILNENHPVGLVIFDNDILLDYPPSQSQRRKMQIWANIYDLVPHDVYANYETLSNWVQKKSLVGHLIIIIGDLESNTENIIDAVRDIKLRNNHVIFLDVWGYPFSYQAQLNDAAIDQASSNYGVILSDIIGRGIEQESVFGGMFMKTELIRYRSLYGFLRGPSDNVVSALERALISFFGDRMK